MAFVYRRQDGTVVDPNAELATLVRESLDLAPDWRICIMGMSCGCTDPGCADVETQILLVAPDDAWLRLSIPQPIASISTEDIRAACGREGQRRAAPEEAP